MLTSPMARPSRSSPDKSFAAAMAEASMLLREPEPTTRTWPVLLAALAFAVCALIFATAAILAPPVELTPITAIRGPT